MVRVRVRVRKRATIPCGRGSYLPISFPPVPVQGRKDSEVHETKSSQVDHLEYSLVDARGPGFSPRPWPGSEDQLR